MSKNLFRAVVALLGFSALSWAIAPLEASAAPVTYQVVTDEIKADQGKGKVVEVYRFDPSVYVVNQGDDVTLRFRGVKGHDHPIELEGYHLKGVIHRNEVTTLNFKASKPGFYRLVCTAHADANHDGPMEAYLVVVPGKVSKSFFNR